MSWVTFPINNGFSMHSVPTSWHLQWRWGDASTARIRLAFFVCYYVDKSLNLFSIELVGLWDKRIFIYIHLFILRLVECLSFSKFKVVLKDRATSPEGSANK